MIKVNEMPYQVFDFIKDGITSNLNKNIRLGCRPSDDYLKLIEESIQFIEKNDKYAHTKRVRTLLGEVKALDVSTL